MRELRATFAGVDEVRDGLQAAIELEFATIPPYLSAMWSVKDQRSRAARLLSGIVEEEMLHMALNCNILNAIGGRPTLTSPGFVPTYPGRLPGGVQAELEVGLRRCDAAQLEVFTTIERPEEPVPIEAFAEAPVTIGRFYQALLEAVEDLGDGGFTGDPGRQLREWPATGELRPVDDVASARWAITLIKEQGEGASNHDPTDRDGELGHYYRFLEILKGREIVLRGNSWAFAGAPIPMPDTRPVVDNPTMEGYPEGSAARVLALQFNATLGRLLAALERTFDGEPDRLDTALGLMYSLQVQAFDLYNQPSGRDDGTVAGPTFELS